MTLNYQLKDLPKVATTILEQSKSKIILFNGSMGAGKTTLIKELVAQLGIKEVTNSPTFSLVNHYKSPQNINIFHFDFYRINSEIEAMDMGVEEYFDSGEWCLIEWSEKIKNLLPLKFDEIKIKIINENERILEINHHG